MTHEQKVEALKLLSHLSYSKRAVVLNTTKNTLIGFRHMHADEVVGKPSKAIKAQQANRRAAVEGRMLYKGRWDESVLTEQWADRKARLAAERLQAKIKAATPEVRKR